MALITVQEARNKGYEENDRYSYRLSQLKNRDAAEDFITRFGSDTYKKYLNYYTTKSAFEQTGLNQNEFAPSYSYIDDLIENRQDYISKYGEKGYKTLYSNIWNNVKPEIENFEKLVKLKNSGKLDISIFNQDPSLKEKFTYTDDEEDINRKRLGLVPKSFDSAAKQIIKQAENIKKKQTEGDPAAIEASLTGQPTGGMWDFVDGNSTPTEEQVRAAISTIMGAQNPQYYTEGGQRRESNRNPGEKGLVKASVGGQIPSTVGATVGGYLEPQNPYADPVTGVNEVPQVIATQIRKDKENQREQARLNTEEQKAERSRNEQILAKYAAVTADPNFEQYASAGASLPPAQTGYAISAEGDFLYKGNNNFTGYLSKYLTSDDISTYNYLKAKDAENGTNLSGEYLQSLKPILGQRYSDSETARVAEYAKENPVLASIGSVLDAPRKGIEGGLYLGTTALTGGNVDPNSPYLMTAKQQQARRGAVAEDMGPWGSFLYNTGMSMGDFLLTAGITGGSQTAALAIMGTGAATDGFNEAIAKGASQEQALEYGLKLGLAEAVFEKFSLGNLMSLAKGGKVAVKEILKQAGIEASEELATSLSNLLTDATVMGDMSNYNQSVRFYMNQGMSQSEAEKKASLDVLQQVGFDVLGGMLSGGLTAGGMVTINRATNAISKKGGNAKPITDAYEKGNYVKAALIASDMLDGDAESADVKTEVDKQLNAFVTNYLDLNTRGTIEERMNEFKARFLNDVPAGIGNRLTSFIETYLSGEQATEAPIQAQPTENIQTQQPASTQPDTGLTEVLKDVQTSKSGNISIPQIPEIESVKPNGKGNIPSITNTRRGAQTIANTMTGTIAGDAVQKGIDEGRYEYTPESPRPTLEQARQIIENNQNKISTVEDIVDENGEIKRYNKQDVALAFALAEEARNNGDVEAAERYTAIAAEMGTTLGQGVQFFAEIAKQTPGGYLVIAERKLARINAEGLKKFGNKWKEVSFTADEKQSILDAPNFAARETAYNKAMERISKETPSTAWEKFDQIRKTMMLGNIKTNLRNTLGNGLMKVAEAVSNKVRAAIELTLPKEERVMPFILKKQFKDAAKGMWENGGKQAYQNVEKYEASKQGGNQRYAFKDKGLGKILNKYSELTGKVLEWGDLVFAKPAFETALARYMQSKNLNEPNTQAYEFALQEALEVTYRDFSKFAEWLSKGGKTVSLIAPFKKTPTNVARRAFDFSQAGLIKTIVYDTIQLNRGKITANQYIKNLSRGITGSVLLSGLGYALGSGIIPGLLLTGGWGSGKEKELQRMEGFQPYSLKVGDTYYSVTWAQPIMTPIMFGSEIAQSVKSGTPILNAVNPLNSGQILLDGLGDLTVFSGLQQVVGYSNGLSDAAGNVAVSAVNQAIPSPFKQLAKTIDGTSYDIYNGSITERISQQTIANIPGANDLLESIGVDVDIAPKVDPFGNVQKQPDSIAARAALNFLSPATITVKSKDRVVNEIMSLYKEIEETRTDLNGNDVLPRNFDDTSIKGTAITEKERATLKQNAGQAIYRVLEAYINSPTYRSDLLDDKVKKIKRIYSELWTSYKNKLVNSKIPSLKGK